MAKFKNHNASLKYPIILSSLTFVVEFHRQLETMGREKQDVEKAYEEKLRHLVNEIDAHKSVNKDLKTQVSAHEITIQKLDVVKSQAEDCRQLKEVLSNKEKTIVELTTQIETHECDIGNYLVRISVTFTF